MVTKIVFLMAFAVLLTSCQGKSSDLAQIKDNGVVNEVSGKNKRLPQENTTRTAGAANMDFEATSILTNDGIDGWVFVQHAGPKSYAFALDKNTFHGGTQSLRIENIGQEPYGLAQQKIPAIALQGKKIILSAWLKTENVDGVGAGLSMRAMSGGTIGAYNFMGNELVRGTQAWKHYSITLDIPETTSDLEIGVMLQGKGIVWADDLDLKISE